MTLTIHGAQALAWSCAAWLLADFLDVAQGEEGATANLMDAVVARLKAEDLEEEERAVEIW